MPRAAGPAVACPKCGQPVAVGNFLSRVDDIGAHVAICGHCGDVVQVATRHAPSWLARPARVRSEERARAHVFAVGPLCPRAARGFTRETLTQWDLPATKDNVVLVVNELIAAAMTQITSTLVVALGVREHVVRAVVADEAVSLPFQHAIGPTASPRPDEMRMSVVDSIATEWGTHAPPGEGLMVWADVAIHHADYPDGGLASTD